MPGKELAPDLHIVIVKEGKMTQLPAHYLYTCALEPWLLTPINIRKKFFREKHFCCLRCHCDYLYFFYFSLFYNKFLDSYNDLKSMGGCHHQFSITKGKSDSGEIKASKNVIWGAVVRKRHCWEWSPGLLTPIYLVFALPTQLILIQADGVAHIAV